MGGHTDGESDVLRSALREAREESGLVRLEPIPATGGPTILDLDVHEIPARESEPAHAHHDVRFLLEASEREPLARQVAESKALVWFSADDLASRLGEESLVRMARTASRWLAQSPPGPA